MHVERLLKEHMSRADIGAVTLYVTSMAKSILYCCHSKQDPESIFAAALLDNGICPQSATIEHRYVRLARLQMLQQNSESVF